mmetsp:Transcript_6588/g.15853  ORF Transcript_6588/g.15853 Transcript_6588/m.15853 type:complete len:566 (+) Transcript_6588:515-2212(+)
MESGLAHLPANLLGIGIARLRDWYNHHLARAEPERPLASKVLCEDGEHSLHRAEDCSVHNYRPLVLSCLLRHVGEVKADRQLEVELHRGALEAAPQRVEDGDVDLRPIEGSVLGVLLPLLPGAVESLGERGLRLVPGLDLAEVLLGARGQRELVVEAKDGVHLVEHLEEVAHLDHHLVWPAEDVRVVLLKPPNPGEPVEGAAVLVAVEHAKVGHADGELAVGARAAVEDDAVPGAVHRLEAKLLLLHVDGKHVLLVVVRVPADLPEVKVVHVGRHDLVVLVLPVLLLDQRHEAVVDAGAVGLEEARAGGQRVEEEEVVLLPEEAVVALLCLGDAVLVVLQLLVVREGDGVHALERVLGGVCPPEGAGAGGQRHRPQDGGVRDVRAAAEVDHRPNAVHRDGRVRREALDDFDLELVLLEHGKRLVPRDHDALEALLLLDGVLDPLLHAAKVCVAERRVAHAAVVVEAFLDGRADGEVHPELELEGLAEDVRRGVPKRLFPVRVIKAEQLQRTVPFKRPSHVPRRSVYLRNDAFFRQAAGYLSGYIQRCGYAFYPSTFCAVWHNDLD